MSFKAISFILLAVLATGSVGARAWLESGDGGGSATPSGAKSLLPGLSSTDTDASGDSSGGALEEALPYLTEGSFFALIGFAVGYLGRKVLKVLLILAGLVFLAVQGLSYLGIASVDWSKALDLANELVLNVQEDASWEEVLKNKIPSAGALMVGFALGFRKG